MKARFGFGSRHIYRADDRAQLDFFLGYTPVPSFVQRLCPGEEFSIDVFCDLDGRCLNAIPRTMIESKGGESIKGMTIKDGDLIDVRPPGRGGARRARAGERPVLPGRRGQARGHRRESPLRRRLPAARVPRAAAIRSWRSPSPAASGPSRGSAISARAS